MNPNLNHYNLDDYVLTYASLPMSYIIHNRQTKYIGGLYSDFKHKFNGRKEVGSMWIHNDTVTSIRSVMENAMSILAYYPSLIIGLHEKFQETLCVLEIVYGHVRSFKWKKTIHAHDQQSAYDTEKERQTIDFYKNGARADVFRNWSQRNEADIELYNYTKHLFDVQFSEALRMLDQLRADEKYLRVPHCESFRRR